MGLTLLVVDDEAVTRRVVAYAMRALNVEVVDAPDAATALQLAETRDINLMLVDINLPDMDGIALISRLRSISRLDDTPIIAFTARNNPDDEMRASEVGAIGFLYKPFSTQELRALVTHHMTAT